jgi:hypothetical protein
LKQNFVHWPARADNHNDRNDIIRHRIIVNLPLVQTTPLGPGNQFPCSLSQLALLINSSVSFGPNSLKNVASSHFFFGCKKNNFEACIAAVKQVNKASEQD